MVVKKYQKITTPKKSELKFLLIGHGYKLCRVADKIIQHGFTKPIILTHSRKFHKRDLRLMKESKVFENIFEYAKRKKIEIFEEDNINNSKIIKKFLSKKCNIVFSLGARSIINDEFLKAFSGLVFNIHPSYLPEERGAANFSWRILNDQNFVAATIHQIKLKLDSGPIVIQKKIGCKISKPTPDELDVLTSKLYDEIFTKFLQQITKNGFLTLTQQKEEQSMYFSRLYTEINGAIDFEWNNNEIERFIRAFSKPYPGAFTFVRNKKVSILASFVEKSNINFHPFAYGRIIKIYVDGSVRIITKNGFLRITKIIVKNNEIIPSNFLKINDVLKTPNKILENSKSKTIDVKNMK